MIDTAVLRDELQSAKLSMILREYMLSLWAGDHGEMLLDEIDRMANLVRLHEERDAPTLEEVGE